MATTAATHSHDGLSSHSHSHDFNAADHGHSHEILDGPGSYTAREMPLIAGRDWNERAFTVGIGGYALHTRYQFPTPNSQIPCPRKTSELAEKPPTHTVLLKQTTHTTSLTPPLQPRRLRQNSPNASPLPRPPLLTLNSSRHERHLHPRRRRIPHAPLRPPRPSNPRHRNRRLPPRRRARRHQREPARATIPPLRIRHRYTAHRIRG